MANLFNLGLDPDVKEQQDFTIIEPGNYRAVIVKDDLKSTRNGNGKYLEIEIQIIEGKYSGEKIIDRLNIINQSMQAQNIGQGKLKRICKMLDAQYPPADTSDLYGKPFEILVDIEEFISNNTGRTLQSNKVKSYNKIVETTQSW